MSAPLVPSPLDYVGRRRFSFYPPIANAVPNDWLLGTGSWAEVQVVNAHTGLEIWVPRQYIGGVSDASDEVRLVVELTKELDYAASCVSPRVKRVIEISQASDVHEKAARKQRTRPGPALVVGIKVENESASGSKFGKLALAAIAVFLLAALIMAIARL
jgi:hypothetical protein